MHYQSQSQATQLMLVSLALALCSNVDSVQWQAWLLAQVVQTPLYIASQSQKLHLDKTLRTLPSFVNISRELETP